MKIIKGKEQEYKKCFDKNDDPYGRRCYTYAEEWAELMEKRMDGKGRITDGVPITHITVEDVAKDTSHIADYDGITGFMYGCAVSVLSEFWVYGEQLRHWHNLGIQVKNEGEQANNEGKVLNPALVTIGRK